VEFWEDSTNNKHSNLFWVLLTHTFQQHIYYNLSRKNDRLSFMTVLTDIFPGEPGLAGFI